MQISHMLDKLNKEQKELLRRVLSLAVADVGTKKSGNHDHDGRPGLVGGSAKGRNYGTVLNEQEWCKKTLDVLDQQIAISSAQGTKPKVLELFDMAFSDKGFVKVHGVKEVDTHDSYVENVEENGKTVFDVAIPSLTELSKNPKDFGGAKSMVEAYAEHMTKCEVIIHEFSHCIDTTVGDGADYTRDSYIADVMRRTMKDAQWKNSPKDIAKKYRQIMKEIFQNTPQKKDEPLYQYLQKGGGSIDGEAMIADVVDAICNGRGFNWDCLPTGHGMNYFKHKGLKEAEIFADLMAVEILHPNTMKVLKNHFPQLIEAFYLDVNKSVKMLKRRGKDGH